MCVCMRMWICGYVNSCSRFDIYFEKSILNNQTSNSIADNVTRLVSGGKDRAVRIWDSTLQPVGVLEVGPSLSLKDGAVAAIDVRTCGAGGELMLLIGTCGKI